MYGLPPYRTRVEDAAKYHEIIESEKIQFKKKENASREIIAEISRKLKVYEFCRFTKRFTNIKTIAN